jgi:hypothetical protein
MYIRNGNVARLQSARFSKEKMYPGMESKTNWTIFDEIKKITFGAGSRSRSDTLILDPDEDPV